jgi:hypothetical protein
MLPHMTDAASILSPGVTIGELCKALGNVPRSTLIRAIDAGEVPEADARTAGRGKGHGHRRWSYASARAIVERAGRKPPKSWPQT